ncbi:MAG: NPCBM/NEW2 domain-containing protein [Patescibacteria group bacterium]
MRDKGFLPIPMVVILGTILLVIGAFLISLKRGVDLNVSPSPTPIPGPITLPSPVPSLLPAPKQFTSPSVSPLLLPSAGTHYLSDLAWFQIKNGWGPVEKDTSNGETLLGDGRVLTINGKTYKKGLGAHAPSEVLLYLGGKCQTFTADVGVDDYSIGTQASVIFGILGDDRPLWNSSAIMHAGDEAQKVNLDVSGKNEIKLVVTDAGDGGTSDHADWADAQVFCGANFN